MNLQAIVSVISLLIAGAALLFTAFSFKRTENHDTEENAAERANMSADIRYIRSSIDEIKLENRGIKKDLDDIKGRVITVEQSVANAHKRLDDMKK